MLTAETVLAFAIHSFQYSNGVIDTVSSDLLLGKIKASTVTLSTEIFLFRKNQLNLMIDIVENQTLKEYIIEELNILATLV